MKDEAESETLIAVYKNVVFSYKNNYKEWKATKVRLIPEDDPNISMSRFDKNKLGFVFGSFFIQQRRKTFGESE